MPVENNTPLHSQNATPEPHFPSKPTLLFEAIHHQRNDALDGRSGNRCGHHPALPLLGTLNPPKTGQGGLPRVITLLIEQLDQYYYCRGILQTLNNANGSERQQRSERAEACVCILKVLVQYMDIATMRVGIPTSKGFTPLSLDTIASQTHMTLKRVKRAFRDLVAAGLITSVIQREKQPDGSWRSYASIKTIQRALLIPFNIIWMLEREQLRRYKQQRKKQAHHQSTRCKSSATPKRRSGNDQAPINQDRPSHPPSTADPPHTQHWPLPLPRKLLEAAHRMGELDPALNLGQCIQQAKQLLA
jgi:hypothetical protein